MADDRTVRVVMRAEIGQYKQAMDQAAKATEKVGESTEKVSSSARKASGVIVTVGEYANRSGKQTESAFQRMVKSAEQNRQAWDATGKVLLTVGTATAALGAAALKTGIEYNQLQQTTRAALTTLLGSASAAADQMDRLDDFARNSPFSKA
ncbi:hypothetical protein, partial [Isoptericola halotolerans]